MTMNAPAAGASSTPTLRLLDRGAPTRSLSWWARRGAMRELVGGCPDHCWKPTARRTAACTGDRC